MQGSTTIADEEGDADGYVEIATNDLADDEIVNDGDVKDELGNC